MKLYLATNNAHKKREMQKIFVSHTIVTPSDAGLAFEVAETGTSFFENAMIKAKALYELVREPVLADDSGICVSLLDGRPGIFSARYGGKNFPRGNPKKKLSQDEQNRALIDELNEAILNASGDFDKRNFPNGKRSAHYVCALVLFCGGDRFFVSEETMEGSIVERIEDARGSGGFGYDPIFLLPDLHKTAAELSEDEKNAISHRGKASAVMKRIMGE